ncbi:MAG TPA: Ig-like domain-containing protein, partial [Candidatus Acidoferrales bacterium]|nr:Ig-like domain-containing protein [Candidatus Acidoferrales bacterium]
MPHFPSSAPLGKKFRISVYILALVSLALPALAAAQCALSTLSPSVTICTPTNGSTVTSPVQVVAGTIDKAHPVTAMILYVDNKSVFTVKAAQLSTSVSLSGGQ